MGPIPAPAGLPINLKTRASTLRAHPRHPRGCWIALRLVEIPDSYLVHPRGLRGLPVLFCRLNSLCKAYGADPRPCGVTMLGIPLRLCMRIRTRSIPASAPGVVIPSSPAVGASYRHTGPNPRPCGVTALSGVNSFLASGPSPPLRGHLFPRWHRIVVDCGVTALSGVNSFLASGPSPPLRGHLVPRWHRIVVDWLIPAPSGLPKSPSVSAILAEVHPRALGVTAPGCSE